MLPTDSPIHDPLAGELSEQPPSDLSDYTWDDSETQVLKPGQAGASASGPVDKDGQAAQAAIGDAASLAKLLVQGGLVTESEIQSARSRPASGGQTTDAEHLLNELIGRGKLTRYQAAAIRQGKSKGLIIGNYIVLDKVGAGGMGLVLKARQRNHQRIVALKLLPPSISRDPAAVIRFRREAAAVAKLRHRNIVSAIEAGETHGLLFLIMEFVEGKDLARLVRERGPLPVAQAVDCVIQAARGLEHAHAHGIIHRDIKPANLLLDNSGVIKILDMGLARVSHAENLLTTESTDLNLTVSGAIVGTVDYMSPEQAYNPRLADGRSDIYSLGCTLHYLLTGKPPYSGQTFMERLISHRERPIPSLLRARGDVPNGVDAIFRGLMCKSPEARPQTLSEVIQQLERARTGASAAVPVQRNAPARNNDSSEDSGSIYQVTEPSSPEKPTRRIKAEPMSTVFVPSRGRSSEWTAGPRFRRRLMSERLIAGILMLATAALMAWYVLRR